MALILGEQEVPSGWIEDGPSAGPPGAVRGLPADTEYLRWELFEAFSGRRASVSLDLNEPPNVRVVASGPPYPLVTPLQPEAVVQAWTTFAAENMLDEATTGEVVKMIGSTPATAWGRIEVPGDNAVRRLGSRFHRARLGLLVDHARKWFANNGKNPADYELFSRRPKTARATGSLPRYSIAEGNPSSHRQTLRERLKRIIDVMSTEQLYELRIPAEFLDT
jgi:hypothetical protein